MSNGLLAVINSLIAAGTTPSSSYCNFEFLPSTTKKFLHKLWLEQQFINPVEWIDLGFFPHKRGTCFLCTLQDQEATACVSLYDWYKSKRICASVKVLLGNLCLLFLSSLPINKHLFTRCWTAGAKTLRRLHFIYMSKWSGVEVWNKTLMNPDLISTLSLL